MSRSSLKFFLALSVLLNLSVLTAAGYKYVSHRHSRTSPFGTKMTRDRFVFEELSLTPEQTKAMREKMIPFHAEIDRRRAEIVAKRKELITLLRADAPDAGSIDAVIVQISAMQEEMQKKITRHMLEEKALLSREQQKAFLDLIEGAMTQGGQAGWSPAVQD